jgi:cobalamin biosynthesis protein CobD/CbiB
MRDRILATHFMASIATTVLMLALRLIPYASMLNVFGYIMLTITSPIFLPVFWFGSFLEIITLEWNNLAFQSWAACGAIYLISFIIIFYKIKEKT